MSIAATIGAVGAVAGGAISAIGATSAAGTQADAAYAAAQLQAQEAASALAFQKQEFATQQANIAPFLKTGQAATMNLGQLLSTPGAGLLQPWTQTFQPPTAEQARATPGYQFQLTEGLNALQNSAAASGGLTTTGTAKGIENYAQGLANTTYGQTYQRALDAYQLAYNAFQQNQANTYNRLAGVSGGGQVAAGQLGQFGQAAAGNVANISLTTGAQQGQALQNAAAATASGYAGLTNALTGTIGGITQALTLKQLLAGGGAGGGNIIGYDSVTGQPIYPTG